MTAPKNKCEQLARVVREAGESGISTMALCAAMNTGIKVIGQCNYRLRKAGVFLHVLNRCTTEGAMYFAEPQWKEAFAAVWKQQVEAKAQAYREAYELKRTLAYRAKRAAEKAADPTIKTRKPRTPKLHALGAVIPRAVGIDGKRVPAHNQTTQRSNCAATAQVQRPVDYSRAVVTICPSSNDTRFTPQGPVPSVVDSRECRGWAAAAVGAQA